MNVLLVGSGGREHALAWSLKKSPKLEKLYSAPINTGIGSIAHTLDLNINCHETVIEFCRENHIDLVVVGPEAPLVDGLIDSLTEAGINAFGPSSEAAKIEGSKGFTKDLCARVGIPTAAYRRFDNPKDAKSYVNSSKIPIVVKADGLAAGKGVVVANCKSEALAAIDKCFSGKFGAAGEEVIVEEFLSGEEASFFVLTDGNEILPLLPAQDHKQVFDNDKGPNTGGMGAYCPAPIMDQDMTERTIAEIIKPTIEEMKSRGHPFKGVLFAGLMITEDGPKLIEYNARFGDPECQTLMMMVKNDLLDLLLATVDGTLNKIELNWHKGTAITVVMAAKGYPNKFETGSLIQGIEEAARDPNIEIFHAATLKVNGEIRSNGGRVLNISARGETIEQAQERAYSAIEKINWSDAHFRKDIGWRVQSKNCKKSPLKGMQSKQEMKNHQSKSKSQPIAA